MVILVTLASEASGSASNAPRAATATETFFAPYLMFVSLLTACLVSVVVLFVVVLFPAVALGQADQAALARRVDGAVLVAGPQVDEDGVHVADGGRIADHMAQRPQLGDLGLVKAGFARDEVSGRGHRDARRLDRLLERHVVIHQVDEHVVDRADDGGAAGRAEGGDRLAALKQDGGRHAAARALSTLDIVRARAAEEVRVRVEAEAKVGELVVEHEAV